MKKTQFLWLVVLSIQSCTTTSKLNNWQAPNNQVNAQNMKCVLVIGLFKDEASRQKMEEKILTTINRKGVASYTFLPSDFLVNLNIKNPHKKIKMDGFDGVLTIQCKDETNKEDYETDLFSSRKSILSFEDYNIGGLFHHKIRNADTTRLLELNLYSVKKDKFVWKGTIAISTQLSAFRLLVD